MKTYNYDDLIAKYLAGEASPEEAIFLENWKSASKDNLKYFNEMHQAFAMVKGEKIMEPNSHKAYQKFQKSNSPRKYWVQAAAAIFVVGLCAVLFLMNNDKSQSAMMATSGPITRTLSDKSKIELSTDGLITFDKSFGTKNRKLSLSGKAVFTVHHDDKLPFIIESNGVFIEDIGTKFEVNAQPDSDTVYVVVTEGIVRLYDQDGHELTIKAGEKAWYIRSQKKIITDIGTVAIKFDFNETKLSEVVTLLADAYDVKINLSPASIGDCKITTQFFDEDIATIISVVTETLGFKYEYSNHEYKIVGKSCL